MIPSWQKLLPLLLVALHLLAVLVSGGHYHAHESTHEHIAALCEGGHAHGHRHVAGHGHGHTCDHSHATEHDSDSPQPARPADSQHDHEHCVVCRLLAQMAQVSLIEDLPPSETAVAFLRRQAILLPSVEAVTCYRSRAPPRHV